MADFVLGHQPFWELRVDGSTVWLNGTPSEQQPADEWEEKEGAIARLDVELGIDMVHTCTFDLVGKDAAVIAKKLFPRRSEIEVRMGYRDTGQRPFRMFKGTVLQGFPGSTYPVTIEMQADSPLYKARELWMKKTGTEENYAEALANFINTETDLTLPFFDYRDVVAEEGGTVADNVLNELLGWMESNGLHLVDAMNGEILAFYPHGIENVQIFPDDSRKLRWELAVQALEGEEEYAAVLTSWAPEINYVDAPAKVTASWAYFEDESDELVTEYVEATIENGVEDTRIDLGNIKTATKEDAQAVVDAWAADRQWLSVEGTFELAVGLPIKPFDTVIARGGPEGLEEFFDKEMVVTHVHHIFDDRGWTTTGRVRGLL